MSTQLAVTTPVVVPQLQHATTDPQLLALWLHGRPATTQAAYRSDIARFLACVDKPLRQTTLADVQAFSDALTGAPATKARILSSVKSLFAFGYRLGYLPFDVGRALRIPARKHVLAERILTEEAVHKLIALEPNPRNRVLLRLLYASGVRVSELCGLTWRDVQERGDAGQVTVFGKGGKTRAIVLSVATWQELMPLREHAGENAPIFSLRKGKGHLDRSQILRIVKAAAKRAKVKKGSVAKFRWRRVNFSLSVIYAANA